MDTRSAGEGLPTITVPILALRLVLAGVHMRGVIAGYSRGRDGHADRDALVDLAVNQLLLQQQDLQRQAKADEPGQHV